MYRVRRLSEEHLEEIARAFSDYEYEPGESGLFYHCKGIEGTRTYIKGFAQAGIENEMVYTISKEQEGYIMISEPGGKVKLRAVKVLLSAIGRSMGWRGALAFLKDIKNAGESLEKKLKKEKTKFITIELLVVRKPYQGQGYMRRLVQIAFDKADALGVPCIVSTDGRLKVKKYEHLGFELVNIRRFKEGVCEYDLIRYPKR